MAETVKAHLSLLYRVGKKDFPAQAETLSKALGELAEHRSSWNSQLLYAGSPAPLVKAIEINDEVYVLLRKAVLSWQVAAYAMVFIADEFVASDESAEALANQQGYELDDLPTPRLTAPPTLSESQR